MVQFVYSSKDTDLPPQELKVDDVYRIAIDSGALSLRLAAVIDDYLHDIEIEKFGVSEVIAVNGTVCLFK